MKEEQWVEIPDGHAWKYRTFPCSAWLVLLCEEHSDRMAEELGHKHEVTVKHIVLDTIEPDVLRGALKAQGFRGEGDALVDEDGRWTIDDPTTIELVMVHACSERVHGLGEHLEDFTGDDAKLLLKAGKTYARRMAKHSAALRERRIRPINAIGTTAIEAGRGDVLAGLERPADREPYIAIKSLMRKLSGVTS